MMREPVPSETQQKFPKRQGEEPPRAYLAKGPQGIEMRYRFELAEIEKLRPHESIDPKLLRETLEGIKRDGYVKRPILVEDKHYVILDGHHRYQALMDLGCKRAPVYLVDYSSPAITLTTWPGAIVDRVSREEVIERALTKRFFPPKTTRHILNVELKDMRVDLKRLF